VPARSPPCVYERSRGAASAPLPAGYVRHRPETTVLYEVVQQNFHTLLAEARERSADGVGLPRFVEREFERYLACGLPCHGFARIWCPSCRHEFLVAFSCRVRGICPSCGARRMHDTAAHLVDRVLPRRVPVRQWVLTFPPPLRLALAYDSSLLSAALTIFIRALFAFQRRRARSLGLPTTRSTTSGTVSFVQRFGSALQLTPHVHTLLPDGVFVPDPDDPDGRPRFHRIAPPSDEEVAAILARVARRVLALCRRRGRLPQTDCEPEADTSPPPLLSSWSAEAVAVPARAPLPGRRPVSLGLPPGPRTARLQGFSLHADLVVHENDREGLERLCRYGLRPALSLERLSWAADGRLRYRLKRTFSDGTTEVVLEPLALMRRLAALVPPPRTNQIRYHGLFAARARGRAALTGRRSPASGAQSPCVVEPAVASPDVPSRTVELSGLGSEPPPDPGRPRRLPWADLLRRVHRLEVLVCERCQGPLRVLAYLTDPLVTAAILQHLGLPSTPPPLAPARGPPQQEIDLDLWPDGYLADLPAAE